MIFLFKKAEILLSLKKWPKILYSDVILWSVSLLISFSDVVGLPGYLHSLTSTSSCSLFVWTFRCLLAIPLHTILVFFLFNFIPCFPCSFRSSNKVSQLYFTPSKYYCHPQISNYLASFLWCLCQPWYSFSWRSPLLLQTLLVTMCHPREQFHILCSVYNVMY